MGKSLIRIVRIFLGFQLCSIQALVFASPAQLETTAQSSDRFLGRLSEPAVHALIKSMRSQFALENCLLHFELLHSVVGIEGDKKTKGLMLIAKSNAFSGKRIYLHSEEQWVEYIVLEGSCYSIWKRDAQSPVFQVLEEALWFKPLIEGVIFRPVDLIMPYVQWHKYRYEGPRVMGLRSVVDDFIFMPDEGMAYAEHGMDAVRLSIDRQYKGIRKVEYLSGASILSTLSILGVKKINGLWALSRLSLERNGSKTIFKLNECTPFSDFETDCYFDPYNKNSPSIAEYLESP